MLLIDFHDLIGGGVGLVFSSFVNLELNSRRYARNSFGEMELLIRRVSACVNTLLKIWIFDRAS